MPPRYPKQDGRFLAWARTVTRVWSGWQPGGGSTGVPDIGLTDEQAQRALELFEKAYAAHTHQRAMQSLARAATLRKREAFKAFKAEIGADISTIEAYAKATRDPGVLRRGGLWARRRATRRHPVAPRRGQLRFDVRQGAMVLWWEGRTLPGTFYRIERRLTPGDGPDAGFTFIASVGERRYADQSIPRGTTEVQYRVSATKHGRTAQGFTVGASLYGEDWKMAPPAGRGRSPRDGRVA